MRSADAFIGENIGKVPTVVILAQADPAAGGVMLSQVHVQTNLADVVAPLLAIALANVLMDQPAQKEIVARLLKGETALTIERQKG